MSHQSYNDIRAFTDAHKGHGYQVVATDQVVLICTECGFSMTVDAVDAGLPVVHDEEAAS